MKLVLDRMMISSYNSMMFGGSQVGVISNQFRVNHVALWY